jgi:hypothetical protein
MNDVVIILVVIFLLLSVYFLYKWHKLSPYNQKPLKIKTFDGFDSPYHPSVLFFKDGWKGWRYWMAETPFSPLAQPYRDRNECPSIHVSNDGIHWQNPEGIQNPLVDLNEKQILDLDYFSDSQLLFVNDHLEYFFRITERKGDPQDFSNMTLCRIQSRDGKDWSEMERWIHPGLDVVSPGITYDENNGYRMWYVSPEGYKNNHEIYFINLKEGRFDLHKIQLCKLKGPTMNPWHIDVQKIEQNLYMTIYDSNKVTLWRGCVDNPLEFEYVQTVLRPAYKHFGSFYCNGLYRSCLVKTDYGVELFFSADDSRKTYIGRMVRKDFNGDAAFVHAGPDGYHSNFPKFVVRTAYMQKRRMFFILKSLLKRVNSYIPCVF